MCRKTDNFPTEENPKQKQKPDLHLFSVYTVYNKIFKLVKSSQLYIMYKFSHNILLKQYMFYLRT